MIAIQPVSLALLFIHPDLNWRQQADARFQISPRLETRIDDLSQTEEPRQEKTPQKGVFSSRFYLMKRLSRIEDAALIRSFSCQRQCKSPFVVALKLLTKLTANIRTIPGQCGRCTRRSKSRKRSSPRILSRRGSADRSKTVMPQWLSRSRLNQRNASVSLLDARSSSRESASGIR